MLITWLCKELRAVLEGGLQGLALDCDVLFERNPWSRVDRYGFVVTTRS